MKKVYYGTKRSKEGCPFPHSFFLVVHVLSCDYRMVIIVLLTVFRFHMGSIIIHLSHVMFTDDTTMSLIGFLISFEHAS